MSYKAGLFSDIGAHKYSLLQGWAMWRETKCICQPSDFFPNCGGDHFNQSYLRVYSVIVADVFSQWALVLSMIFCDQVILFVRYNLLALYNILQLYVDNTKK